MSTAKNIVSNERFVFYIGVYILKVQSRPIYTFSFRSKKKSKRNYATSLIHKGIFKL